MKEAWGDGTRDSPYSYPSFDVEELALQLVAKQSNCSLEQIRFYTGVPSLSLKPFWHKFWTNKLRYLRNNGVKVQTGHISSGGHEKGVDVSIAIDLIKLTYERRYEVVNIVSSDQDFGPAIRLAKQIAKDQGRNLEFYSSQPTERGRFNNRGIAGTQWIKIDKNLYDACIDPKDYRSP